MHGAGQLTKESFTCRFVCFSDFYNQQQGKLKEVLKIHTTICIHAYAAINGYLELTLSRVIKDSMPSQR